MTATESGSSGQLAAEPPDAGDKPAPRKLVRLEDPVPLSESIIWRLHEEYFASAGIGAWATGAVPHVVTTGPILALSYARIVEGFVADCRDGCFGPVDPGQPLFVVELGAGSGRFGFQFLKALRPEAVEPFRVVYVLTDRVESNVRFWAENGKFDEFVAADRVDFARFSAGSDSSIHLERSGLDLDAGRIANPMVAIANYFFDVLPQDLFAVIGDELCEELVSAYGETGVKPEATRDYLRGVRIAMKRRPVGDHRYGNDRDRLLHESVSESGSAPASAGKGSGRRFLFPSGAIQAVRGLSELSSDRVLVIAGERLPRDPVPVGDERPNHLFNPASALSIGIHGGSISLPVDLGAVARAAGQKPAALLTPRYPPTSLLVSAILGGERGDARSTRAAFAAAVDDLLPGSMHQVLRCVLRRGGREIATLRDLLAILRLARFDPRIFDKCRGRLETLLVDAPSSLVDDAIESLHAVFELDYPLTESTDLAADIANLLEKVGRLGEARWFMDRSNSRPDDEGAGAL
jgi:hypothetical protein